MMVVQKKMLPITNQEQMIKLPATAEILSIISESAMYLGVHYLNTGGFDVERYFWVINTLQQVDDEKYGPFKFINSVTTPRGLVHVFERITNL